MKLSYYVGKEPNFGDDLNAYLWPKLLPNFFDDNSDKLFVGIGSILGFEYPKDIKKIVFGSGYVSHYGNNIYDYNNDNWDVFFVRGKKTAETLGLSQDLAIGDSAILIRAIDLPFKREASEQIAFIPHWESMKRGNWQQACDIANIKLIDPRLTVEETLQAILSSKFVICEAMHGAIVADALRVPWVPVMPVDPINREKWYDWASVLDLELQPNRLMPSSVNEARVALKGMFGHYKLFKITDLFSKIINKILINRAANCLSQLAKNTPQLSDDKIIKQVTEQMLEKVKLLKRKYNKNE